MGPKKVIFVLSTGRTGTKALAEGLKGSDGISSHHQPPFSRMLTVASNYYLHGWLSQKTLEHFVRKIRVPQILGTDCTYYIQTFSLDYLPAYIISRWYSNVYIIHIVRDPRTFVKSYLNWSHKRFKSFIANKLVFGWHPSGYFTGEVPWTTWSRMNEFQRVCWHWKYKNSLLQKLFDNEEYYIRVRFEDLFLRKNTSTLKNIIEFVGIPYEERFSDLLKTAKNVSQGKYVSEWEMWSHKKRRQLMDICGELMKIYGYA
jgi:hypothetical protein